MIAEFVNDREFILKFAKEVLGYPDSKAVARVLSAAGAPLPFNVEHLDTYIRVLTKREPCMICGGPTIAYDSNYRFCYPNNGGVCWRKPTHNVIWWVGGFLQTTIPDLSYEKAQLHAAGGLCGHERLLVDCRICMISLGLAMLEAQKGTDGTDS